MSKSIKRAIGVSINALQSAKRRGLPQSFAFMASSELIAARNAVRVCDLETAKRRLEIARTLMQVDAQADFGLDDYAPRRRSYREAESDGRKVAALVGALSLILALALSAATFDPTLAATLF